MRNYKYISLFFLYLILCFLCEYWVIYYAGVSKPFYSLDIYIVGSFFLNLLLVSSGLFFALHYYRKFSYFLVFFLFFLIFLIIIPQLQYISGILNYSHSKDIILANTYIFIFCFIYMAIYLIVYYKKSKKIFIHNNFVYRNNISFFIAAGRILFFSITFLVLGIIFFFWMGGSLIASRLESHDAILSLVGESTPIYIALKYFVSPIFFIILLFLVFFEKNQKRNISHKAILYLLILSYSVVVLLINNPLSYARFYSFTLLMGSILIIWPSLDNRPGFLTILIIFGLLISPALSIIRYSVLDFSMDKVTFDPFDIVEFDGYQNFLYVIKYVDTFDIEWGRQFLGGILFFVPRIIWPDKPIGSGTLIAEKYLYANFTNISMPMIGEGYLNFGIIGIVIVSIVYAIFTAVSDAYGHLSIYKNMENRTKMIFVKRRFMWAIGHGLILFNLRGDFMSSFAFSIGIISSVYIAYYFMMSTIKTGGNYTW